MSAQPAGNTARIAIAPFPRWIGFIGLCIGMGMAILDIQVVVTSLPVIEKALNIGSDQMSWVQTAYIIAEVIAIPLTGLMMRVFGLRRLLLWALVLFTLASIGCAYSHGFTELLLFRVAQGVAGGVLIPIVFSAIFLLFTPSLEQDLATTLAGLLAVLGPTLGPLVGGWLTQNYDWTWLFLVNIGPGILGMILGYVSLPKDVLKWEQLRDLDYFSLLLLATGMAGLLIGLKYAPHEGWLSWQALVSFFVSAVSLIWLWARPDPVIMFHLLKDRSLAFGCALSFITGFVLFANVYLIPVFMAYVRNHSPLEIGLTTLVMGLSQLVTAPLAVYVDRRFNARLISTLGFAVFGVGLFMNAYLTVNSDYNEFFWPQLVRGVATGFMILPPIRFAMALMPLDKVGDSSGLFNVSRNIGGALGIAVVDTLIWQRTPFFADLIKGWITSAPEKAAAALAMKIDDLPTADDAMGFLNITEDIGHAALTNAINEGWILLGVVSMIALPLILWLGPVASALPVKDLLAQKAKREGP